MSFEGYYRVLCENGHLSEWDCYDRYDSGYTEEDSHWRCGDCGAPEAWRQLIDQTNDSGEDQKWPLEIVKEAVFQTCDLGCNHEISPTVYKIPNQKDYEYSLSEYDIEQILTEWYETKFAANRRVRSMEITEEAGEVIARIKANPVKEQ